MIPKKFCPLIKEVSKECDVDKVYVDELMIIESVSTC